MVRNSTTEEPDRCEHFERLRCVSFAVWGMEKRSEEVILVWATSRWVRCRRRGRREEKTVDGRIVHSWKLRRVIGRKSGRGEGEASITALNASLKFVLEQAQKSRAFSCGRLQRRYLMTLEEMSSSMCS